MRKPQQLNENELLVLSAILHLGDNAYGVTIQREIADRTRREPSTATIYLSLNRLETKGLVKSKTGGATAERGGRRKSFYRLTANGERAFKASLSSLLPIIEPIAREWGILS